MDTLKVIVVMGGGYESEYARKLFALLSDRGINSALWTEKEYLSNRPKLSNKEHIIFFGLGDETKKQAAIIRDWVFDSYACRIGWLGNTCVITAWDGKLPWDDLDAFAHLCKSKAVIHPDIVVPSSRPGGEVVECIKGIFTNKGNHSVWRAQYSLLIYQFLDNYLDVFIGKKPNDGV